MNPFNAHGFFRNKFYLCTKILVFMTLFLGSVCKLQAQPYQAATWAGYNSNTQTFPMNGTLQTSYVTAATHNFSGLGRDEDSRTVWVNPNTSSTLDIATAPYLSYTVTTNAALTFDRFVLSALAMLGNSKLQLRWSIDNFASSLGEFTADGGQYTLTSVLLGSKGLIPAGTIEFRIYYYAASSAAMVFHTTGNNPSIDGTPSSYGGYVSASLWYSNAVTTSTNMAISFNGTSQYANLGSDPALAATNIKTMECWVKFNSLAGNQEILSRSVVSQGIELLLFNNNLAFFCMNGSNGSSIAYPTSNLQTGVWYHIAAAWNGTKESMQLYVNGKPVGTRADNGNINTVGVANPTGTFKIGQWSAAGDNRFLHGTVDEVRIWNTMRTASEIKSGIYGQVPANSAGLLAYYNMNESAGDAIINSSTSPVSIGNTSTLLNGVTRTASPVQKSNNTLSFDGVNDYVSIPANSAYDFTTGTIECWVRPDGFNGNSTILATRVSNNTRYSFHMSGTQIGLYNGSSWMAIAYPFNTGQWYHLAFVCTPSATKIYVNGNLIGTTGNTVGSAVGLPLQIGMAFPTATGEQFKGIIDEVRIWNVERTPAEILSYKNSTLNGNEAGLVAYLDFDQGLPGGNNAGVTTAIDASGTNNHGTLLNFNLSGPVSNWVAGTPALPYTQSLNNSPVLTFNSNSGFTNNIAVDGTGGSVEINDINIQVMPIDASGAILQDSPLEYHNSLDWSGYPGILTYGSADPHAGWAVKSDNGAAFSLLSLDFMDWGYSSTAQPFVAEAFRGGVSLGTVNFSSNTTMDFVHLSRQGILTSIFDNVDEVRIYKQNFANDVWPAINNIEVFSPSYTLPVRLTTFTARPRNNQVLLNWSTASEQNSKYFEVERSADGSRFISIGTLAAAGNAQMTSRYQFTDAAPMPGTSFYRLRQVDADGATLYSPVQKVVMNGSTFSFTLLQNPVVHQLALEIQLAEAQKVKLEIRDAKGGLLLQQEQGFSSGTSTHSVPVSTLPKGTYFISLVTTQGTATKVFIKQ